MALAQTNDILLDSEGALPILTGFFMGDSRGQHINDILTSNVGEWKRNPEVGVNIGVYIKSIANPASVGNIITSQLKGDKFSTSGITVTSVGDKLKVKGKTAR